MSSVASPALVSSAPATVLVESVSHEDSAISHPRDQNYLGGAAAGTKHIWWLTYANKSKKRSKGMVVKLAMIKK